MGKRSREKILAGVLESCLEDTSKSRIIHRVNLNNETATSYIEMLVKRDLLIVTTGDFAKYRTSEKGKHILESLKTIPPLI